MFKDFSNSDINNSSDAVFDSVVILLVFMSFQTSSYFLIFLVMLISFSISHL
jgi:hypothetical protein